MTYLSNAMYIPLLVWFCLSIYWFFGASKDTQNQFIDSIPSGFTTSGVLGTFLGIFIGLQDFNVDAIQESIPLLLEGLKGAFLTSIAGIILSMISQKFIEFQFNEEKRYDSEETRQLRKIVALLAHPPKSKTEEILQNILTQEIETKDILASEFLKLNTSTNKFINFSKSSHDEFKKLINELISEQIQTSLKTQEVIAKQATEINQNISRNNTTLIKSIEENNQRLFEKLAEMNSKELLNAMEESVKIFNKKMEDILSRLIKENFDALNKSVNQLNNWQEQHKANVDSLVTTLSGLIDKNNEMIKSMESATSVVETNLSKASTEMDKVANRTKELTQENGKLQTIIKELENIFVEENIMTQLVDSAQVSVDKMNNATDNFTAGIEKVSEIENQIFKTNESMVLVNKELQEIAKFKEVNGDYWADVKIKLDKGVAILNAASTTMAQDLENIDDNFKSNLDDTFSSLDQLIKHYIERID